MSTLNLWSSILPAKNIQVTTPFLTRICRKRSQSRILSVSAAMDSNNLVSNNKYSDYEAVAQKKMILVSQALEEAVSLRKPWKLHESMRYSLLSAKQQQRLPLSSTPKHLSRSNSKYSSHSFRGQTTTKATQPNDDSRPLATQPNDESRPLANFHPNIWGDRFLLSDFEYDQLLKVEKDLSMKVGALTQELKSELNESNKCLSEKLKLIDTIQRLGIEYHFEEEIDRALQDIYENYLEFYKSNNNLYINALGFRLLRQHGHRVSCEIFEKFKDVKGEFKASITSDVIGMLEFYEATYLGIKGEDVLDHGYSFTRAHLRSTLPNLSDSSIGKQVSNALDYSYRRGLPRLEARKYISIYEQHAPCHENLLKLAKLDFNRLQSSYKRELSELCSWWKDLDIPVNFPFARDRCAEIYLCALGVYIEPKYIVARKYKSRILLLLSLLDDTYDAYGTFEELQTFTQVLERWRTPSPSSLPRSMEILYKALWEVVEEIKDEMINQEGEYRAKLAKEAIITCAKHYYEEAKCREKKDKPMMTEEYMSLATNRASHTFVATIPFIGMGDIASKDAFDWMLTSPALIKGVILLFRLSNDIAGHEFEKERDHIHSAVECYMKEHDVSKQEAIDELNNQIEVAWKDINEGLLTPTKIPALHRLVLNLCRLGEVIYRRGDWYTHVGSEMQNCIKQLLIDQVPE